MFACQGGFVEQRDADGWQWTWGGNRAWRRKIARRNSWGQLFYSDAMESRTGVPLGPACTATEPALREPHGSRKSKLLADTP
ncbi:hypothetical protein RISK_003232 [Rhodopirellula islandica]|uniref:Uncharacterized protein n=1 Tax=Rhodopirellula islandica TaxID=595434 RepID=A0A0J1BDI4_RHOIS|nr:hypothetical protein RISK_003232 [Rhodopirellula islandica]